MKKLFYILIAVVTFSCRIPVEQEYTIGDPVFTEFEQQQFLAEEKSNHPDTEILSSSLHNLTLVNKKWNAKEFILCSEDETFLLIKQTKENNLIAISVNRSKSFFFYELTIDGDILSKYKIEGADYSILRWENFLVWENHVTYYNNNSSEKLFFEYNAITHAHTKDVRAKYFNCMGEEYTIEQMNKYHSPNFNYLIEFSNTNLTLVTYKNHQLVNIDTLISQEYEGSWSFGTGAWNASSDKFYFDNSGAVACIWELDIINKTLDKIVPEHTATAPIVFESNEDKTVIVYCEENCIKMIRN